MKKKLIAHIQTFAHKMQLNFADWELLLKALTHSTYAFENDYLGLEHNERLEYLGDTVLQLVISAELYQRLPEVDEGKLTNLRSLIVREETQAAIAREIGLDSYLLLGNGAEKSGDREKDSVLCDAMEAVIGALYLDQGYDRAKAFIEEHFAEMTERAISGKLIYDFKSLFIQYCQAHNYDYSFTTESSEGPSHDIHFTRVLTLNGRVVGKGVAGNKKQADQLAAKEAAKLIKL